MGVMYASKRKVDNATCKRAMEGLEESSLKTLLASKKTRRKKEIDAEGKKQIVAEGEKNIKINQIKSPNMIPGRTTHRPRKRKEKELSGRHPTHFNI